MRRTPATVLLLFAILTAFAASACSRAGDDAGAREASARKGHVSTTTAAAPTTTTTEAPTTTTTEAPTTTTTSPPSVLLAESDAAAALSPAGIVVPILARQADAVVVGTPCERQAQLRDGTPLRDVAVVLDAGHGGGEPGAVGPSGLREKDINLTVARHVQEALQQRGLNAVLTRTGDYRMTLEARAKVVRALKPRLFVSVHHNAEPDGPFPRPGSETYYQVASADSKRMAGLLYEELIAGFSAYQAAWVADSDAGAKYRKSDSGDDYYGILRRTQGVPAVLSEALFVSNPDEESLLSRDDVLRAEATAIVKAIERFLNTPDPGSGFTEPYPRTTPAGPGGGSGPTCVDPAL